VSCRVVRLRGNPGVGGNLPLSGHPPVPIQLQMDDRLIRLWGTQQDLVVAGGGAPDSTAFWAEAKASAAGLNSPRQVNRVALSAKTRRSRGIFYADSLVDRSCWKDGECGPSLRGGLVPALLQTRNRPNRYGIVGSGSRLPLDG